MALKEKSSVLCFGGQQKVFTHESDACKCTMTLGVFIPPQATDGPVPVLYFLSGLTCTHENFVTKAGGQRMAAERGVMIVCPDTSPRGVKVEGDDENWDFGTGAGFYVDATKEAWKSNYNMYTYVTSELPALIEKELPASGARAITGHSMGGHGALVCALKNPGMYRSVTAFAPICHPSACPWGVKAFTGYLGAQGPAWAEYDATELVQNYDGPPLNILIDCGKADGFYEKKQLLPEDFVEACRKGGQPVVLRMQEGYDHSYYFIASFVEDHIAHAADFLK